MHMDKQFNLISFLGRFCDSVLVLIASLFLGAGSIRAQAIDAATTWQLWEHTLTSQKSYPEPYQDVTLTATFTGPAGRTFAVPGYWSAGNSFKLRGTFPVSGVWKWTTTCSDTKNKSLHQKTGQVTVVAYTGSNPLYQHGFLRVGNTKRYLTYADGTPFLWMGDTGWLAIRQSTLAEWKAYVDDRATKGFTIIQAHLTQYALVDSVLRDFCPIKAELPNPDYFKELEAKIGYANQKGIVLMLVGLGVSGKGPYIPELNTPAFARYLTGRLASYAVILSPSMDAGYDDINDQMATLLKSVPSVHLITQHVGTKAGAAAAYHVKASIDFTALQSGHHNGNLAKAYEAAAKWSQELWQLNPTKPVVNSEAMYDGRGNNEGNDWREQDARKLGWIGWLSGALGYTYGAGESDRHVTGARGGMYRFVQDSTAYDYWQRVLSWPSGAQMSYMKQFVANIPWWQLEPDPGRILNQPTSPLRTMALSRSQSGDLLVAYLPENHDIKIRLDRLTSGLKGQWFDPTRNQYWPISDPIGQSGEQTFLCPGPGDWVLLLRK